MKTDHQNRIEKFMNLAKQDVPSEPSLPDPETCRLRASLILEEALETIDGLGCEVLYERSNNLTKSNLSIVNVKEPSLVDIADGCADISVVTIGTLSACGIPDKKLLEIVDQNNLDKFGEGHSFRPDGKLIKPPDHRPPDILGYINSLQTKGDK